LLSDIETYKRDQQLKQRQLMDTELEHSQAEQDLRIMGDNCVQLEDRFNGLIEEYALLKNDAEDAKEEYDEYSHRLEQDLRDLKTEVTVLTSKLESNKPAESSTPEKRNSIDSLKESRRFSSHRRRNQEIGKA